MELSQVEISQGCSCCFASAPCYLISKIEAAVVSVLKLAWRVLHDSVMLRIYFAVLGFGWTTEQLICKLMIILLLYYEAYSLKCCNVMLPNLTMYLNAILIYNYAEKHLLYSSYSSD